MFGGEPSDLSQFFELGLDGGEIGEISRAFQNFGVLDDASFVDDEGGALWHATHDQVFGWQEAVISHAVSGGDLMIVVAEELKGDAFFFSPGFLCKWIVTADADDLGVQGCVGVDALGKLTEFRGADAREGHRDKQKQNVRGADVFGELEQFGAIGTEGGDGKIRGGRANRESHGDDVFGFNALQT